MYDAGNSDGSDSKWNDISCYHKLGGVICKRKCVGSTNGPNCGSDGWEWAKEGNSGREYKIFNVPTPGNYWQVNTKIDLTFFEIFF